ncbi:MAG: hypothetical protein JO058_19765 [Alphaproteobacteria bacterium]|nr:hypothetical protein [Alphaproteobacteria bacterium]
MARLGAICGWLAITWVLLGAFTSSPTPAAGGGDAELATVASEARQVIAVINWFYLRHRACPQPSRPGELAILEGELGDGFSATQRDWFVEIRGISMTGSWLYYTSARYPDRCTLWRELGQNATLIWRRHDGGRWTFEPGDGGSERPIKVAPVQAGMGDK